jgi:hypothetical protein
MTHVQKTDRRMDKSLVQPMPNQEASARPKVQQMRTVGHVRQKDMDIPEATPITTEKISPASPARFSLPSF